MKVAPRFYQTIEAKNCPSLATEVSARVDELLPGFAWVFGPGENGDGHSFTLSGEGNPHRQLLAAFWLSQAPKLSGWTFYAARQPGPIAGQHLEIGGKDFDPIQFWLTPTVDRDHEKVDITVWHPLLSDMEERERWTVLFLFLDEVLGEFGTQQWIGEIKLNDRRLTDSIPLEELHPFLKKLEHETDWKKHPPGKQGVVYKLGESGQKFLRGDTIAGSTTQEALIHDYLDADGELSDPLAGTGADYVFVSFDAGTLPRGEESASRGKTEDALDKALRAQASGQHLGGAVGTENAYIDLLLFDGASSLQIVKQVLNEHSLPPGTSLNYFAKEKRGHRIVL